jgi:NAD(P)H-flavin reductase
MNALKRCLAETVTSNSALDGGVFRLECTWRGNAPRAGQFFMLKPKRSAVFLGRPVSVAALTPAPSGQTDGYSVLAFLIVRRGQGTEELADMRAGEELYLTGPLGNAWQDVLPKRGKIALAGGGIGIAPLTALLAEVRRSGAQTGPEYRFDFYAGFRTAFKAIREQAGLSEPDFLGAETVIIATEDGSEGKKGRVPVFLDPSPYSAVCACGPEPMLAAIAASCRAAGIPCYLSLERRMACGVGACLGCTVETVRGNKRCCADGPIFPAEELLFV